MNVKYVETARKVIHIKLQLEKKSKEIPACLKSFEHIVQSEKHQTLNSSVEPYDQLAKIVEEELEKSKGQKFRILPCSGGEVVKPGTIPPWPPNVTNLEAFKNLLLNRKMLIKQAGGPALKGRSKESQKDIMQEINIEREESEMGTVTNANVSSGSNTVSELRTEPRHFTVVSKNTEGPIVIRNQMNKPVSVEIKAESAEIVDMRFNADTGNETRTVSGEIESDVRKSANLMESHVDEDGSLQVISIDSDFEPPSLVGEKTVFPENQELQSKGLPENLYPNSISSIQEVGTILTFEPFGFLLRNRSKTV